MVVLSLYLLGKVQTKVLILVQLVAIWVLKNGQRAHRLLVRTGVKRRYVGHLKLALPSDVVCPLDLEVAHLYVDVVAAL